MSRDATKPCFSTQKLGSMRRGDGGSLYSTVNTQNQLETDFPVTKQPESSSSTKQEEVSKLLSPKSAEIDNDNVSVIKAAPQTQEKTRNVRQRCACLFGEARIFV